MSIAAWWASTLTDMGVEGDPRRWARAVAWGAALAVGLGLVVGGIGGAAIATLVSGGGAAVARWAGAGRGARRADATLPDMLEHAARSLRGGFDLVSSLDRAALAIGGLHGREVQAVVRRVGAGASLAAALAPWGAAHPRPPVRLIIAALEVAVESGGRRVHALVGVAAAVRSRAVVAAEVRALASQAQASAAVLIALPLVFAAVGSAADPQLAHTLLATPVGLACVVAALVLDGAGAVWMQRIVRAAEAQ